MVDIRIYYEDTDAAGLVYHANFIKFLERARTEYFRRHGFLIAKLAEEGFIFPVVRMEIDFKSPAFLDDLLSVETTPARTGGSTLTLCQRIVRQSDQKLLVEGFVKLACINKAHKAIRVPLAIRRLLESESVGQ